MQVIREEGWAFKLICLYLFFEYVRPQSIYPVIETIPWAFIVLLLTAVILLLSGNLKAQPNILNKLIVAYALIVIFSIAVTSQYPSISLSRWRVFFNWFFIYFMIVLIVNNEKRFFIFFLSFLLYSFKMSQHGFFSWLRRGFAFAGWGVTGAPGWFRNSGEVGIQMCIYVPLAISFILATYKLWSKPKLIFFFFMPFTGIATAVASSSRGALVGLATAGIRPLFIKPRIFFISSIVLSLVATLTIMSIPGKSMRRFHESGKDRTSLQRIKRWHDGLESMHKYPVFLLIHIVILQYTKNHNVLLIKYIKTIKQYFGLIDK